ncbi:MAG TPA: tetratricopeptide repeat protein [bacterium]
MSANMAMSAGEATKRCAVAVGVLCALIAAGCAGVGTGSPSSSGGSGTSARGPSGAAAAAKPDFSGPEVTVDVTLDQAALDESIRKAKEFEALVARAEGGDDEAQFDLAERYAHGREVEPNPTEAKKWYLRAADSGHEKSREMLVSSYIRNTLIGYEPKTDFVTLLPWLRDAAKSGNVVAQEILAQKYAKGEEVPRDYLEAQRWLQALADRGFVHAQYSLAVMYHQGLGVEPNPTLAYKWFEAAAKQNDPRSQYMVALMNYYGRGTGQSVSAAKDWAAKAAAQRDPEIRTQAIALLHMLETMGTSRPTSPPPAPAAKPAPSAATKK